MVGLALFLTFFVMGPTFDQMQAKGLGTRKGVDIKILAKGEISKPLTVHAHGFSASARAAIEAAGGTCHIHGE